jgi:hypothetical protein
MLIQRFMDNYKKVWETRDVFLLASLFSEDVWIAGQARNDKSEDFVIPGWTRDPFFIDQRCRCAGMDCGSGPQ